MVPAWRDPKYISEDRVRQFEEHEELIRRRERERERRRWVPTLPFDPTVDRRSGDFEGAEE